MVVRTCTGLGAQGDVWYLSLEGILMFPFLTLLIFLSGTPFPLRWNPFLLMSRERIRFGLLGGTGDHLVTRARAAAPSPDAHFSFSSFFCLLLVYSQSAAAGAAAVPLMSLSAEPD